MPRSAAGSAPSRNTAAPGTNIAVLYASEVYRIIRIGLTATAPTGEAVKIAPTAVRPDLATARDVATAAPALPTDCTSNPGIDCPSAYNCIVPTSDPYFHSRVRTSAHADERSLACEQQA